MGFKFDAELRVVQGAGDDAHPPSIDLPAHAELEGVCTVRLYRGFITVHADSMDGALEVLESWADDFLWESRDVLLLKKREGDTVVELRVYLPPEEL